MKFISWNSSDPDCVCHRLLQTEERRLEESILTSRPEHLRFLRIDLRDVRRAIKVIQERNTKEFA